MQTHGALHHAVNNAGIGGAAAPAGETDLAEWQRVINSSRFLQALDQAVHTLRRTIDRVDG